MANYVFSAEQENLFMLLKSYAYSGQQGAYVLMHGPPGSGKTKFVTEFAEVTGLPLYQITGIEVETPKHLFYRYDIAKMTAGQGSYQVTPLFNGVRESMRQQVIILLDEVDKTPEATDGAFLQLLDTERCFFNDPYGDSVDGNNTNMFFFMTTNGRRGFTPELMRRMIAVDFSAPDQARFKTILLAMGVTAPDGLLNYISKLAVQMRSPIKNSEYWPTPPEMARLIKSLQELSTVKTVDTTAIASLLRWNLSKNIDSSRWEEIINTVERKIGNIPKAIKSELG